ncbi:MAG: hypothetical protein OXU23_26615 [Candidatus Poribacteria bacterium]|nr:hypothetical protein [Candidatus Poribacteria bacterium]
MGSVFDILYFSLVGGLYKPDAQSGRQQMPNAYLALSWLCLSNTMEVGKVTRLHRTNKGYEKNLLNLLIQ